GSAVLGNIAQGKGGGIFAAQATLLNVTVTENSAHAGGGLFHEAGGSGFSVKNTIVAGNLVDFAGTDRDVDGDFTSAGHNLIGDPSGGSGFFGSGDQVGTFDNPLDPRLGPLAFNGGRPQTHALLKGSPAIDKGDNTAVDPMTGQPLTTDQRGAGFPRKKGSRAAVDIGAFER